MAEVEVKFLDIDRQAMVARLVRLGARKVFDGEIYSENFDFSDRRIAKGGSVLRLRKKSEGKNAFAELTIKTKLSKRKAKISDETEFIVLDYGRARRALLSFGLRPVVTTRKHRLSFSLGEAHFEFDKVAGIPLFLEIESDSLSRLRKHVEKMGLSMKDAKPWSMRDVLRYYRKL
jgi:predicted adenylyl cyclase CyaB